MKTKMKKFKLETVESIMQWHKETFPKATLKGQIKKFNEEDKEFVANPSYEELADMYIVACGLCRYSLNLALEAFAIVDQRFMETFKFRKSLETAICRKMAVNRKRQWNVKDGLYKHKDK